MGEGRGKAEEVRGKENKKVEDKGGQLAEEDVSDGCVAELQSRRHSETDSGQRVLQQA